jgi:hypothetical protein
MAELLVAIVGVCDQKTSKFFVSLGKNPWQDTWVGREFIKS